MGRSEPVRERRTTRAAAVAAVAGLGLVVMLAASLQGLPEVGVPRFLAPDWLTVRPTPVPLPPEPDQPPPTPVDQAIGQTALHIVGGTLLALVIVLLAVLAARLLLRAWRGRRMRLRRAAATGADGATAEDALAHEQRLRRGLVGALEQIGERPDPSEAIIAAWVELERSTSDAGISRGRSETPAEFTLRVIARTAHVATEAQTLLALYERVRFGGAPADEHDRETARAALAAVEEAWR